MSDHRPDCNIFRRPPANVIHRVGPCTCDWEARERQRALVPDLLALLRRISAMPCDHGAQDFCPREEARILLPRL